MEKEFASIIPGKLDDLWFLGALSVVASKADLLNKLLGPSTKRAGMYGVLVKLF
jgi:hypothetical protein